MLPITPISRKNANDATNSKGPELGRAFFNAKVTDDPFWNQSLENPIAFFQALLSSSSSAAAHRPRILLLPRRQFCLICNGTLWPSSARSRLLLDWRRGCAQPFDKRRFDRVGLGALAASAQLFHQAPDAQRTDAAKIVLDG